MTRDLYSTASVLQSIKPAAYTATVNGTGVDLLGYESAFVVISAGVRTDGTHTFKLEESDDNSAWNDVAAADQLGASPAVIDAATDEVDYDLGYVGSKRYLRVTSTVASATTGAIYGASVVRGHAINTPVHA